MQVDLYIPYQKCAEFLQNPTAGKLDWMNDINKEDNAVRRSGNGDEGMVSYFIILMISCFLL
jgi:hypothetical protein